MYPGLAKAVLPYADPELVMLGWNAVAEGPPRQALFTGGYCEECRSPIGARSAHPVVLSRAPKADICGYAERMSNLVFISETVVAALSKDEVDMLELREVSFEKPNPKRRRFLEVTGPPRLCQVGVRGGKYWRLACWQCSTCGARAFACSHPKLADTARAGDFIARSDYMHRQTPFLLVGDALGRPRIAMTMARFSRFASSLPGVSLWPGRLFLLDDDEVERHPTLPSWASLK